MNPLLLPQDLEPYRKRFEKSIRPFVKIKPELIRQKGFDGSRFGGYPYLPLDVPFPKDSKGDYMTLLAQIHWEEVPRLEGYPEKGITQFFIARTDDYSYGYEWDKKKNMQQKEWKILHYPTVIKDSGLLQQDFSFLPNDREYYEYTPLEEIIWKIKKEDRAYCLQLDFELDSSPALSGDYEFPWRIAKGNPFFWTRFYPDDHKKGDQLRREYNQLHYPFGHKIGGYAGFSQEDWRTFGRNASYARIPKENPWMLLLQIESGEYIQWGDSGVGNFFIRKKDLLAQDFSKVRYHWDCC